MYSTYRILNHNQYYIDKTGALEKGILVFPSIYIEGAAACGKTTAVKMLLENHPETACAVFDIKKYQSEESLFCQELMECLEKMSFKSHWVIFENLHANQSETLAEMLADFVRQIPEGSRAVFASREKPPEIFLDLLWKQQMMLCRQQNLIFNKGEVNRYVHQMKCTLDADEIYRKTGGWAGCVSMLVSLSLSDEKGESGQKSVDEYMGSYEMRAFIRREILDTLGASERDMVRKAGSCPWINEMLCREVWNLHNSSDIINSLVRKGLLLHDARNGRWQLAPMVRFGAMDEKSSIRYEENEENVQGNMQAAGFWEQLGRWYDNNGYVREALYCLKKTEDPDSYRSCIIMHFSEIPFLGVDYKDVVMWQDDMPEICYLRGMYYYMSRDFTGLSREIRRLEDLCKREDAAESNGNCREIYMNLNYVSPGTTLDEWLTLLEESGENGRRLRLYHVLGNSPMALCGLRDLSGLFACSLKEEKRKEKIWKNYLDDNTWKFYQLARMDYYMETLRSEAFSREDRDLLFESALCDGPWQMCLARYYLLCKYQKIHPEEGNQVRIGKWKEILAEQENVVCQSITEAVGRFYEVTQNQGETLNQWLRYSAADLYEDVTEDNFSMLYFCAKSYFMVNQYDKAKKILRLLIPYVRGFKRNRYTAELLFQDAIVHLAEGSQGQALRSAIESFLLSGSSRYVYFYTGYGKKGLEVMELYIDWMRSNTPEGWHRKKKYNYGNVVRMPKEDYLDVILRRTRREMRTYPKIQDTEAAEKLTMMETMVLQELGRGLTNADICQSLNLKMTTVKSHVYSVYKKLGVNSRVQAVLKGKELGIIR